MFKSTEYSHFLPVITEAPEDPAESIENVLEDGHNGVEMIIIDKC